MVKLSFFNLRFTNVKLKNIKLHLRLLTGKLKKTKCRSINIAIRDWNDILHNSEYLKRNRQA